MKSMNGHQGHVEGVLAGLTRAQLLQTIAYAQRRQAHDAVVLNLLQARLAHLTSGPAQDQDDGILTVPQVAKMLQLSTARIYELTRTKVLRCVTIGERQVRVRRSDLDEYLARTS